MTVGVLLAAGESTRFGDENKLLAAVDGEPIVRRAARTLLAAPVDDAVAVLGHEADRVARALDPLGIDTLRNPDYAEGQGTSVAAGARWASDRDADAVVFALGDVPFVAVETYERLVAARRDGAGIAVPEYEGRRGNPVLFGREHFPALQRLDGDQGGRILFDEHPVTYVAVDDPGILRDVDRPDDLAGDS